MLNEINMNKLLKNPDKAGLDKSGVLSANSIRVTAQPYFHVLFVVVVPNLLILFLHQTFILILHYHDFIVSAYEPLRNSSIVYVDLTEHLHVFVLKPNQILVVLMPFDWNRRVVVEKQVEQRHILCLSVIVKSQRLFPNFEHHIPEKPEKHFWRNVLTGLFNLVSHVFHFHVNVLQTSLSFQT